MGAACCNYQPKDQQALNLASKTKPVSQVSIEQQQRFDAIMLTALTHRKSIIKLQAFVRGFLVRRVHRFSLKEGGDIDAKMKKFSRSIKASGKISMRMKQLVSD